MPQLTETPSPAVATDLMGLRTALNEEVPARIVDHNFLIATWNIRAFSDVTEKWKAGENDSPKRDLHCILVIAEILSRFDVIAIQEVRGNLKALRYTLDVLGPEWGVVFTDVTRGDPGNNERMAFIFDSRRIQMSGLAGELVVPENRLDNIGPHALQRQFARTPYAVSFRTGSIYKNSKPSAAFILVTLHILYGDSDAARIPELRAIARWLDRWANDEDTWNDNFIALGDFNIDRAGGDLYQAFASTGLNVPEDLMNIPRTIFSEANDPDSKKFYDQIAWFTGDNGQPALSLKYRRGGYFDFTKVALPRRNLSDFSLSWRISDHFPLWVEFLI